jgi:hypothetical protein
MSATDPSLNLKLQRLREVRRGLLRLHKALLHSEREVYEQLYEPISSSGEFLRLAIEHEWFSWLRPMSQFIVQMDDVLTTKEPVSVSQVNQLLEESRQLLQASETGTTPEQRYYDAIQRDPDIAFMHAELSQLLTLAG